MAVTVNDFTYVHEYESDTSTDTVLTIPVPDHVEGQLLVFVYSVWRPVEWTYDFGEAGWTPAPSPADTRVAYRIAGPSEPASYTIVTQGDSVLTPRNLFGWMYALDGADTSDPFGDVVSVSNLSTTDLSLGDAPVSAGDAILGYWTWQPDDSVGTLPSGWTNAGGESSNSNIVAMGGYRDNLTGPTESTDATRSTFINDASGAYVVINQENPVVLERNFNEGVIEGTDAADSQSNPSAAMAHSTANPFEGSGHARFVDATNQWLEFNLVGHSEVYISFPMYISSPPIGEAAVFRLTTGSANYRVRMLSDGRMRTTIGTSPNGNWSLTPNFNTWDNIVGLHYKAGAGGTGVLEGYLNGALFGEVSLSDTSDTDDLRIGAVDATNLLTYDMDNVKVRTDTWATHTQVALPLTLGSPISTEQSPFTIFASVPVSGGPNPTAVARVFYRETGAPSWTEYENGTIESGEIRATKLIPVYSSSQLVDGIRGLDEATAYDVRFLLEQDGEADQEIIVTNIETLPGFRSWNRPHEFNANVGFFNWAAPTNSDNGTTYADVSTNKFITQIKGIRSAMETYRNEYEARHGAGAFLPLMGHCLFNEPEIAPDGSGGYTAEIGLNNNFIWDPESKSDFQANVEPYEDAFLHEPGTSSTRENRFVFSWGANDIYWFADPASERWVKFQLRQWVRLERAMMSTEETNAKRRIQLAFHDNIHCRPNDHPDYEALEYPSAISRNDDYREQVVAQLQILQQLGMLIGGNITIAGARATSGDNIPAGYSYAGKKDRWAASANVNLAFWEAWASDSGHSVDGVFQYGSGWIDEDDWLAGQNFLADIIEEVPDTWHMLNFQMKSWDLANPEIEPLRFAWFSWAMVVDDPVNGNVSYRTGSGDNFHNMYMNPDGLWDTDLGMPTERFHATATTSVYEREFENYTLLVNPSTTDRTHEGTLVPAHNGALIATAPEPEPEPGTITYHWDSFQGSVLGEGTGNGTGGNWTCNPPLGYQEGDGILLFTVATRGQSTTRPFEQDSDYQNQGFTLLTSGESGFTNGTAIKVYGKLAGASESTYSGIWAGSADMLWEVFTIRVSGVDPTTPFGPASGTGVNDDPSLAVPGITPTEDGSLLVSMLGENEGDKLHTAPSGMTGQNWRMDSTRLGIGWMTAIENWPTGNTATGTRTWSWTDDARAAGVLFAVYPAPDTGEPEAFQVSLTITQGNELVVSRTLDLNRGVVINAESHTQYDREAAYTRTLPATTENTTLLSRAIDATRTAAITNTAITVLSKAAARTRSMGVVNEAHALYDRVYDIVRTLRTTQENLTQLARELVLERSALVTNAGQTAPGVQGINECPPFSEWTLLPGTGTATVDENGQLHLAINARARVYIPTKGQQYAHIQFDVYPEEESPEYAPDGGWLIATQYFAADKVTSAVNDTGNPSNGNARALPQSEWSEQEDWYVTLGDDIRWLMLTVSTNSPNFPSPTVIYKRPYVEFREENPGVIVPYEPYANTYRQSTLSRLFTVPNEANTVIDLVYGLFVSLVVNTVANVSLSRMSTLTKRFLTQGQNTVVSSVLPSIALFIEYVVTNVANTRLARTVARTRNINAEAENLASARRNTTKGIITPGTWVTSLTRPITKVSRAVQGYLITATRSQGFLRRLVVPSESVVGVQQMKEMFRSFLVEGRARVNFNRIVGALLPLLVVGTYSVRVGRRVTRTLTVAGSYLVHMVTSLSLVDVQYRVVTFIRRLWSATRSRRGPFA